MTFRGSDFGGPRHAWGEVPGTPRTAGGRNQWNSMRVRGPRTAESPEAGVRRGEWQWRGHGPDSASNYAWEYRGGVSRDATVMRTEAGMGPRGSYERRLAEERGGGLPRGRERFRADRMWDRTEGDHSRGTRWAVRAGGYDRDFPGYDRDFGGRGRNLDDERPPLSAAFNRLQRLERDPRWQGDSQRLRQQLETGPGNTRWPSYHNDRGILWNSDGRF